VATWATEAKPKIARLMKIALSLNMDVKMRSKLYCLYYNTKRKSPYHCWGALSIIE
jgi:hypothetical protein